MQIQKTRYPLSVWISLFTVYILWGSTYLGIRIAIETIPTFFMGGSRFLVAGGILYLFTWIKGESRPSWAQWKSAALIGFFLLAIGNGGVCLAENKVPSGIVALVVGIVPLWMVLLQWLWKKGPRPDGLVWIGIAIGITGISLLVFPKGETEVERFDPLWVLFLIGTSLSWTVGSLYAQSAKLPTSPLQATAMEMITGGIFLLIAGLAFGEPAEFHWALISYHSVIAWLYLVLFGSLIGFTSYIWVLHKATPALASTYAFVNPVIAVILGWIFAGEALTSFIFLVSLLIVAAVAMITLDPNRSKLGK